MPRFLKRLLLAIAAPVLLVGGAEVFLRLIDYGYPTSFLVPDQIAGREVWRDNPFFGYRFFPERMTRTSQPIVLDRKKPADVIRVFVLGESAAMGEPQALFGPARFLECILAERCPEAKIEVVNAAMTAINSHVITEIARDIAKAEPDVLVLYIGNNEVVGPFGPGTVIGDSSRLARLTVKSSRLRLAQLVRRRTAASRWAGMEMFEGHEVEADDDALNRVYNDFLDNIHDIINVGRKAGAEVVISTVAVNLRDCAPFAGEKARIAFDEGRYAEARDLDTLRFRADSTINQNLRNVGTWSFGGARLVDAEKLLDPAGSNVFIDHVHFSVNGTYQLSVALADAVIAALGDRVKDTGHVPSLQMCQDRLHYLPWNELDVVDAMLVRRSRAPFTGQPGNMEQTAALRVRRAELQGEIGKTDLEPIRKNFAESITAAPLDWRLYAAWGEILLNAGLYAESEQQLRRELELLPHRFEMKAGLAMVLAYAGRAGEGVKVLADLPAKSRPLAVEHLLQISRTLAKDRRIADAEIFAFEAARLSPDDPDILFELARDHALMKRAEDAKKEFKAILVRWPDYTSARNEWSAILAREQRWDEAELVLQMGRQDADAQLKRVQIKLARRDFAGADALLAQVEASGENAGAVAMTRGLWQMMNNDPAGAASSFSKAVSLQPDARTFYELARAYQRLGRTKEARETLETALRFDPACVPCRQLLDGLPQP